MDVFKQWPWVRFRKEMDRTDYRWFWTPITYRFGHGGWVYASLSWLWRFRNGPGGDVPHWRTGSSYRQK